MEDKKLKRLKRILQGLQDDLITVDDGKAMLCDLFNVSDSFSQDDLDKEYDKAYAIGYREGQKE